MLLRWWHEGVRHKPFRPVVEAIVEVWYALVGVVGYGLTRCWRLVTRQPPVPSLPILECRHILCLRPDRLGDVVLVTPSLAALRARYPAAEITVLASEATRPVLEGHPAINAVVAVRGSRLLDFWRDRATLRGLRERRCDMIIVFQSSWSCVWLAWWLGAPVRLGYDTQGAGFLLSHAQAYPYRRLKTHQVVVNGRLVMALGCREDLACGPLQVPVSSAARAAAHGWLERHGFGDNTAPLVVMHPGSRSRYTRWAPERFGQVADWVQRETTARVVWLCGRGEETLVARAQACLAQPPPVAQDFSLELVAGLLSWCQIYVGNATGTTHLAAAVGPCTVMVIGGTHPLDCPERWEPWGAGHRVVHKRPVDCIGRDTSTWLGPEGLQRITPDDVIAALRPLLPLNT